MSDDLFQKLGSKLKMLFDRKSIEDKEAVEKITGGFVEVKDAINGAHKSVDQTIEKLHSMTEEELRALKNVLLDMSLEVNVEPPIVNVPEPKVEVVKETEEAVKANDLLTKLIYAVSKQAENNNVKILNSQPSEAIPVILTEKTGKRFYDAIMQAFTASGKDLDREPLLEIARGAIPGQKMVNYFGTSADVSNTTVDLWPLSELVPDYIFSTNLPINRISSSSTDDNQFVLIEGLDFTTWKEVQAVVQLNGQTPVVIPDLIRHNRTINISGQPIPGLPPTTALDFQGNVTIYEDTPVTLGVPDDLTKVRGIALTGSNATSQGIYTIPLDKRGFSNSVFLSVGKDGASTAFVKILLRPFGGVFIENVPFSIQSPDQPFVIPDSFSFSLTPGMDIRIQAEMLGVKASVSVIHEIILEDV